MMKAHVQKKGRYLKVLVFILIILVCADSDPIVDNWWGPYKPILAVTGRKFNGKPELIPGRLCAGEATYPVDGVEFAATDHRRVYGELYKRGEAPKASDQVGLEISDDQASASPLFIGVVKVPDGMHYPGKVKDGICYYGYGGREQEETTNFVYFRVTHVEYPTLTTESESNDFEELPVNQLVKIRCKQDGASMLEVFRHQIGNKTLFNYGAVNAWHFWIIRESEQ